MCISRSALKEGSDFLTIEDLEAYGHNSHIPELKIMDFVSWNESYFFHLKENCTSLFQKIFVLLDFPNLTSPSICVNPFKSSILNLSLSWNPNPFYWIRQFLETLLNIIFFRACFSHSWFCCGGTLPLNLSRQSWNLCDITRKQMFSFSSLLLFFQWVHFWHWVTLKG